MGSAPREVTRTPGCAACSLSAAAAAALRVTRPLLEELSMRLATFMVSPDRSGIHVSSQQRVRGFVALLVRTLLGAGAAAP